MSAEHLITFAELQERILVAKTAALMDFEQWQQGTGAFWNNKPSEDLRYAGSIELSNGKLIPMHSIIGYMAMISGEPDVFGSDIFPAADAAVNEASRPGPSS
ncbi:MAG TPA: hypothetical protein VK694_01990 [Verrucomicrobiae bacterium]|nr:hypothetical protein [Verrucomicrobiae bacterium]